MTPVETGLTIFYIAGALILITVGIILLIAKEEK